MKPCSECKQNRILSDFLSDRRTSDGLGKVCLFCQAEKHHMSKKEYEIWLVMQGNRQSQINYYEDHKEVELRNARIWVAENRERVNEYSKNYHRKNPHIARKANHKRKARKSATIENPFTEADCLSLIEAYEGCCAYCGNKTARLEMDHVIPLSRGGKHTKANIVPACFNCNRHKAAHIPEELGMKIRKNNYND